MKSPFPGMDPYIEGCGLWEDFHPHLIEKVYEAIAEAVPERYIVRTGERSYVVLADAEEEENRESFVEIYESAAEQRLVTCIEVLSPSNKRPGSTGWNLYLRKRQGLLMGAANLVEIDLLRGGRRMPMRDPWPNSPFTLLVARKQRPLRCRVWPAHFQHPLPPVPVPLVKPDPDVVLNLQPMADAIYARSRYFRSIDYARPLTPPIGPAEAAWLEQQRKTVTGK